MKKFIERLNINPGRDGSEITDICTVQFNYGFELRDTLMKAEKYDDLLDSYIDLVIDSINNEYSDLTARFSRSKTEQEILKIAEGRLSEEIKLVEDCSGVSWDEIKKIMEEMEN